MTEIFSLENLEQKALDQLHDQGHINPALLDLIIADWGYDINKFDNPTIAREVARIMIVEKILEKHSDPTKDIPDITA